MSENNLDALQRELKLRKVRQDGKRLLKGHELHDFLGIQEKQDRTRDETEKLYRDEYKIRVDVAYKMLLRKSGAKTREFSPPGFGLDRFNTRKLTRDAQMLVRFEHQRTMTRLDESELKQSTAFLEKCSQRKSYVEAFKQTSERRQSERRSPSPTISD